MKIALFTVILLGWMCVGESDDRHTGCCLTVTNTRIPVKNIVDYDIQEPTGTCPLRAVRFRTIKYIIICSDPEDSWAKRAMNDVNGRRMPTEQPCEEAAVYDGVTATTTAIQRTGTEGYGHPESCCSTAMSTTIPVKIPAAFRPLLTRKRSHSKKMLHKYQSKS
ncbi:C-C motif chemokine 17-like [Chanodichthys erythropterus]|uniref:C-C motif chemokine 17-like n=1 Tax=Chanodichthys erythropterus TaxID=933992 RepID=UPI00351E0F58